LVLLLGALAAAVLLMPPRPLGAVALGATCFIVVGMLWPSVALALVLLSVPLQDYGAVDIGVGEITATRLAVVALALSHTVNVAFGRVPVQIRPVAWAHLAVIAALMISVVHAVDLGAWAGEVYRWTVAGIVYVIAESILRSHSARRTALFVVGLGVLTTSVIGFVQVATVTGPPSYVVGGLMRAHATFGAPNTFAAFLELSVPLLFVVSLVPDASMNDLAWLRWWCRLASVAGVVALVLTQSRGGILGFAVALVVVAIASGGFVRLATACGLLIACGALLLPAGESFRSRFADIALTQDRPVNVTPATWANQERAAHWGAGLRMMAHYPATGVGAGQYNLRYREFTPTWRFRIPRGHAHNGYIHMGAQAGIVGLVAMSGFVATSIAVTARALAANRRRRTAAVPLGALAVVVAFSVHSLVDYLNVLSLSLQLAVIVALATATPLGHPWMSTESNKGVGAIR
ncbi:MAG: O-antigen ligase family protein, partial [Chloroflexota bacterium]|nr:O-antigen ligase family protein [Chloroflexota bacterium]